MLLGSGSALHTDLETVSAHGDAVQELVPENHLWLDKIINLKPRKIVQGIVRPKPWSISQALALNWQKLSRLNGAQQIGAVAAV